MNVTNNGLEFHREFHQGYRCWLVWLFVVGLLSPAVVQGVPEITDGATDVTSSSEESARLVESALNIDYEPLYRQHCAACHGDKGDGKSRAQAGLRPPPRNFTTAAAWQELDRDRMINSVTFGRPNTAMVGWEGRLSEVQIAGVVDYLRVEFMRPPTSVSSISASPEVANASKHAGSNGRAIYKRNCSACHGDRGNGSTWTKNGLNPPPRDFTTDEARDYLTRERMITSVTYGRLGTAMMPFNSRLSPREIASVVDYIRDDFMRVDGVDGSIDQADVAANPHAAAPHPRNHPGRNATAGAMPLAVDRRQSQPSVSDPPPSAPQVEVDMTLQLPHGLVGNRDAGRTFFMANCSTCHGLRGDGHGPRSSFITPRPRNFLGERARRTLNRPALFRAIAAGLPGTVMPSWSKVLNNQQIADVTEFVFQTFIQHKKKVEASSPPMIPLATKSPGVAEKSMPEKSMPEKSISEKLMSEKKPAPERSVVTPE